jgi:hypothetical protein
LGHNIGYLSKPSLQYSKKVVGVKETGVVWFVKRDDRRERYKEKSEKRLNGVRCNIGALGTSLQCSRRCWEDSVAVHGRVS